MAFLPTLTPLGVKVTVQLHSSAYPARVNPEDPSVQAGLRALEKAFGVKARLQGEGGTIPVVSEFEKQLGIPTVLMGFNLIDDCIHAPNERFSLANFQRGILASAYFWNEL